MINRFQLEAMLHANRMMLAVDVEDLKRIYDTRPIPECGDGLSADQIRAINIMQAATFAIAMQMVVIRSMHEIALLGQLYCEIKNRV